MHTIRWYRLLAAGMLAVPIAGRAQATAVQGPQPKITEIATIPGVAVRGAVKMPNGRILIYVTGDSIAAFDAATKRSTLITRGVNWDIAISPRGDRIAYGRLAEDRKASVIWAISVDPATGAPTGTAQRVSTSSGDSPSFSRDGKQMAFFADKGSLAAGQDLVVVPATGGTQRSLAHYDFPSSSSGIFSPTWSADGRWIYLSVVGDSASSIERVPVAGGNREMLYSHVGGGRRESSNDGKLSFFPSSKDRMAFTTAGGVHGEFTVPTNSTADMAPGFPEALLTSTVRQNLLHVVALGTGTVRDVLIKGTNPRYAVMSSDAKQLAVVTGAGAQAERVVMNADGSGERRYPVANGDLGGVPSWSRDGSSLMYAADSGRTYRLLNLATGTSRVIASEPAPGRVGVAVWRPDGKSFLTITTVMRNPGFPKYTLVEFGLDGTRHVVRDLSAEFPALMSALLTSPQQVVMAIGDSITDPFAKFFLMPVNGGAARPVVMPAPERGVLTLLATGTMFGAHSDKWFVALQVKAGKLIGIQVMSTGTDSTRGFRVPDMPMMFSPAVAPLLVDDGHLVVFGQAPGDQDVTLHSVPLDGTASRIIGHVPDPRSTGAASSYGLSADRTQFAFFSAGPATSHIYDVDLTPIYQLINKKP